MDLLAQYSDDEGDSSSNIPRIEPLTSMEVLALPAVDAAPTVDLLGMDAKINFALAPTEKKMLTNPSVEALYKPLVGPVQEGKNRLEDKYKNHKLGHVQKARVNETAFEKEYLSFHNYGYAANPGLGKDGLIESTLSTPEHGKTIWDKPVKRRRMTYDEASKAGLAFEQLEEDAPAAGVENDKWGGFADEADVRRRVDNEVRLMEEENARQKEEEKAVEGEERETKDRVTSIFHGSKETDYKGRGWLENKASVAKDIDDRQCFLPKKWLHTWQGHTMGVQQIKWFPKTAHLLLSASMDGTVKIWDYHNQRKCLRTYMGHDQAVRDINFTDDGKKFYSCSYDKNVQYWDTETGQVICTFTNKKTPFCVTVHPDPAMQNVIFTGCSNKKAVQWDANTATIVQEYDEHLGAVNSVTCCEEGKRLLTTSDDKKIFVWEFGIPVVVKYIAEPTMHSVPSMVLSPNKKLVLGQSMDNKMIVYEAFGRFRFQMKRQFKGHINSGYAINGGWSADGRWVMSGDTDGKVWFWDFAKMKNYRVLKAHDGVCISCLWHPHHTSRIVTCGWDGAIKLWD